MTSPSRVKRKKSIADTSIAQRRHLQLQFPGHETRVDPNVVPDPNMITHVTCADDVMNPGDAEQNENETPKQNETVVAESPPPSMCPSVDISRTSSEPETMPSVRLLVQAYTEMLQKRASHASTPNISDTSSRHMFFDRHSTRKSKSRNRPYREEPHDRRWLTWDTLQDPHRWLSDPNIGPSPCYEKSKAKERLNLHELRATPSDDGCHSDLSPSPTWSGVQHSMLSPEETLAMSSVSSLVAGSIEEFPLSRSASCSRLPARTERSMSQDSAVDIEPLTTHGALARSSDSRELTRSEYTAQWNPYGGCDPEDEKSFPASVGFRPRLKPPSVVISDHSGETVSLRVALMSDDFKLSSLSRGNSLVTEPLSEFGLSVSKVCPRKVSDCSTCSSVSTVDMSPDSHLSLDELVPPSRRTSCCSNCSVYTTLDQLEELEEVQDPLQETLEPQPENQDVDDARRPSLSDKTSNWRKVKNVVQWTPFIQTYKRHKYPWVQLAGHQGNFKAGEKQGTILKKLCPAEQRALEGLMKDVLRPYVPEYMGLVESGDQEQYLQLQDLLSDFTAPCVMDIKMGVRTYLEEELAKAREKPKLRKDMYEKMIQIDPQAPSEAEQRAQAVTKPRYMVWRETISSTATLGFRIEGVKKSDGTSSKDFKTTRTQEQVLSALAAFVNGYDHAPGEYLKRLKEIRTTLESSKFFMSHELIGSSLLFVHNEKSAEVWLIDFAKSIPLPSNVSITHRAPWVEGSHEDGYLLGLDNLIKLMAALELHHQERKKGSAQQKTSNLNEEEEGSDTIASVSSDAREQEGTSGSKTGSEVDGARPSEVNTPTDCEQQPSRVQQNSSESLGTRRNIASSFSNSFSEESKDPKLNDNTAATPSRETNDDNSRQTSEVRTKPHLSYTSPSTKVSLSAAAQVQAGSRKVPQSSSGESHSPTDIRNMIKNSTEMNSIS